MTKSVQCWTVLLRTSLRLSRLQQLKKMILKRISTNWLSMEITLIAT